MCYKLFSRFDITEAALAQRPGWNKMGKKRALRKQDLDRLDRLFNRIAGRWTGCDWDYEWALIQSKDVFINIKDIPSYQIEMIKVAAASCEGIKVFPAMGTTSCSVIVHREDNADLSDGAKRLKVSTHPSGHFAVWDVGICRDAYCCVCGQESYTAVFEDAPLCEACAVEHHEELKDSLSRLFSVLIRIQATAVSASMAAASAILHLTDGQYQKAMDSARALAAAEAQYPPHVPVWSVFIDEVHRICDMMLSQDVKRPKKHP
jgi:hypothetical protein